MRILLSIMQRYLTRKNLLAQALREPSKARDEGVQMQPLRALHLDSLCPEGMRALSERVPLFSFDFSAPPGPGGTCCDHQVRAPAFHARACLPDQLSCAQP